jgi:phosphoglycolate phosphatase
VKKTLFFDLDGTLTNSSPGIVACLEHALTALSIEPPPRDALKKLVGPPLRDAFIGLLGPGREGLVDEAVELYRGRFRDTGMFENSVYPGVIEGLTVLSGRGHRLFVVTAKPHVFAERIASHFGFRSFFEKVYGPEFSGERADKRDLIAHVVAQERLDPRNALMIGDRSHDVIGAKHNGVDAVGVLWGYGSREELLEAGAAGLFTSMPDLVRHLASG